MVDKLYTDEQLINSLKSGQEFALTEIYRRYWKKMIAVAYRHTNDKIDAEEIVQTVFIKLWDKRESLEILSLPNYLATAIKYSVFNALHKKKREVEVAEQAMHISAKFHSTEDAVDARFMEAYINGLVEKLPEKCQLVFNYSRKQGKKNSEIALELNIAEKTVEAHLTKAIKSLSVSLRTIGLFSISLAAFFFFS
jgi:RNA polymerase sigma-70 factor (family 1)